MSRFIEIRTEELNKNPFELIGGDWMLVTAKKENKVNTMTASWGGMGIMWNKNVAYTVLRPQRYTKEFVDGSDTFSLSFLGKDYKKILSYLGTVSGRDEDKISKSGLKVVYEGSTSYFEESDLVLICRKLYSQELDPKGFIDGKLDGENYSKKDYHTLYISEILKVLVKE